MFHLSKKFLVNNKFVGAFAEKEDFVVQEVYLLGEKKVFSYKHFPLPRFLTKKALRKWEEEIEKTFSSYTPAAEESAFLKRWIEETESSYFVGIGNYLTVEEAVKLSPLVVVYRWKGKKLTLGKEAFKPIPDRRAYLYLLPCGAFPETIEKLGVEDGA